MKKVKLVPSPENTLAGYADADGFVPLTTFSRFFTKLPDKIPEDEKQSARVKGWESVEVIYDHKQTKEEKLKEDIAEANKLLDAGSLTGLTPEQVAEVKRLLAG